MQIKSSRGVQLEEVFAAADALLAEKVRPTIERVRLKLGRGSPNTVSPMLEAWFAQLGNRLTYLELLATTVINAVGCPASHHQQKPKDMFSEVCC